MEHISILDAKARLFEIIEKVQATGQPVTITQNGQPVVEVTPTHTHGRTQMTREQAFEQIARLRQVIPNTSHEGIRDLIDDGKAGVKTPDFISHLIDHDPKLAF
jgi:prevent-host-death family protein